MENVKRYVTVFDKGNDDFVKDEFELKDATLSELQELFSVDNNNPMYDCFEITEKEVRYFIEKFNLEFDMNKHIYYLECYSSE